MIDTRTPHVEPEWAQALLLELRLRGVAGSRIGAVLAEVEAHCAESGEVARDAFGDPVGYAAALDLPESPLQGTSWREVTVAGVGLLGMFSTAGSVAAWQTGTPVTVTVGAILAALAFVTCLILFALRPTQALRLVVDRPIVTALAFGTFTVAITVLLSTLRQPLLDLPWQPLLTLGLLLVIGDLLWSLRHRGALDDPVVGPGPDGAGTLGRTRLDRVATGLGPWLTPLVTTALTVPWFFV